MRTSQSLRCHYTAKTRREQKPSGTQMQKTRNVPEFFQCKHDLVRANFLGWFGSLLGTEDNHLVSQMVQSAEKRGGASTPPVFGRKRLSAARGLQPPAPPAADKRQLPGEAAANHVTTQQGWLTQHLLRLGWGRRLEKEVEPRARLGSWVNHTTRPSHPHLCNGAGRGRRGE